MCVEDNEACEDALCEQDREKIIEDRVGIGPRPMRALFGPGGILVRDDNAPKK